jgi:hypothetical protein
MKMLRFFSTLVLLLALAAPVQATPPPNPLTPDEAAIHTLLDNFNAAAARADGPAYFGSFTPNAVFVGTDASERWTLPQFRAFAEPYFSQGKGWTYTPTSRTITFADIECRCVAWFEENLDSASYGTTRGAGMVVKGPDGWKIGQYVLTIPIPNDIAKDVVADIKAYEANHPR